MSLLDDEHQRWTRQFTNFIENGPDSVDESSLSDSPLRINVTVEKTEMWFEVVFPKDYPEENNAEILVKGNISRREQESWQSLIRNNLQQLEDTAYPVYQLFSLHVLPLVHDTLEAKDATPAESPTDARQTEIMYHALFTSHHLISPTKRRSLQKWSSEKSLHGFAKVGYPGVIYCEGMKSSVEEFVVKVKAMQWLALRLRFIEPLEDTFHSIPTSLSTETGTSPWREFEKVGEVVQFMRQVNREGFVTEMGLGSAAKDSSVSF